MKSLLKLVGRGVKRAFSKDGGTLSKLTDNLDRKDGVYYLAFLLRGLVPVLATGLAYWFASLAGVPVAEFLETVSSFNSGN